MIICGAKNFGFVHVPKCAGSSIRWPLKDQDDMGGRFFGSARIDGLGRVNMNHLPMIWLRDHFPDAWAALGQVESYALVRDPMDRFVSAMAQRARGLNKDPGAMRPREVRELAETVVTYIEGLSDYPEAKQIVFAPQRDFVFAGPQQAVTHIWPVEAMPALRRRLQDHHGLILDRDQIWNPTVTYRRAWMAKPLKQLKETSKRVLPMAQYAALRDMAVKAFTTHGAPVLEETLRGEARFQRFVADFYAADHELHHEALAAHASRSTAAG